LLDVVELLVEHAQHLSFDEFSLVMRRWEMLADADGSFRDHEAADRDRTASIVVGDAAVDVRARGGSAQGITIMEIFQRFVDEEFATDWAATVGAHGDAACPALMPRTDAQRRFDAFHRVFLAAASTSASAQAPEPVVNIITTLETLEAAVIRARVTSTHPRPRQRRLTRGGGDAKPATARCSHRTTCWLRLLSVTSGEWWSILQA
jgi:hypothetical protein